MTRDSEAQFISKLLKQDEDAYRQLVTMFQRPMLSVAQAIVGSMYADEVVQEAWVSIINALPSFQQRSSIKVWIMRIVANQAKSRLRRESRHFSLDDLLEGGRDDLEQYFDSSGGWARPPVAWSIDTPDGLLEQEGLMHCIEKIMGNLPSMQKTVLILKEVEALSVDEICNTLELSASNVRVLLHRARHRLLASIDNYQETGECLAVRK